jgi:hypothetical protein
MKISHRGPLYLHCVYYVTTLIKFKKCEIMSCATLTYCEMCEVICSTEKCKKVKLSLRLTKHHVMKTYEGVEV